MFLSNYTKEFKYNWQLAAPVMLGMLGHTFVGFVDNIMVGQLGTAELAAVSLGNSFMYIEKEKLLVLSNFFSCHYVFKKPSAAEASESVYMRESSLLQIFGMGDKLWLIFVCH